MSSQILHWELSMAAPGNKLLRMRKQIHLISALSAMKKHVKGRVSAASHDLTEETEGGYEAGPPDEEPHRFLLQSWVHTQLAGTVNAGRTTATFHRSRGARAPGCKGREREAIPPPDAGPVLRGKAGLISAGSSSSACAPCRGRFCSSCSLPSSSFSFPQTASAAG